MGTGDTGLDWFVITKWFDEGLSKMASALLLCILISAILQEISFLSYQEFFYDHILLGALIIFLSCLGMGNIVLAILVINQPRPDKRAYVLPIIHNHIK